MNRTLIKCKDTLNKGCIYKCQMPYKKEHEKTHLTCRKCGGETNQRIAFDIETGWKTRTVFA